MLRLVQIKHPQSGRQVALVEDRSLRLLRGTESIFDLAQRALEQNKTLAKLAESSVGPDRLDYDAIHAGNSEWIVLPAFDHPVEPARCLVTGTGLTHDASAKNRQAMHAGDKPAAVTDSMKMFQLGVEGGRPAAGKIGVAPEWFYRGCGTILRGHREPLEVPNFGLDGGEEAEVAGVYVIDGRGVPRRVGFALANEFSDHKLEEQNYLYLAPSKLRTCAIGPELVVESQFADASGTVRLRRGESVIWERNFATGEKNMSHSLANLEHHHFKYAAHRRPGDVHIHFFGADAFSFGDGIELADGDVMELELAGFGRPLCNPLKVDPAPSRLVRVEAL